jgi:hypothetical protein
MRRSAAPDTTIVSGADVRGSLSPESEAGARNPLGRLLQAAGFAAGVVGATFSSERVHAGSALSFIAFVPPVVVFAIGGQPGLYAEYAGPLYLVFLLIGFAQAAAAFVYFLEAVLAPRGH